MQKARFFRKNRIKKRFQQEDVDSLTKATKGANAINAINAAVGLGLGIYGAHQINKMQRPSMVSAPQIEGGKDQRYRSTNDDRT